jgi:hypothetical protein
MAIAVSAGRGELLVATCAYRCAGWRHGDRHQRLRVLPQLEMEKAFVR